MYIPLILLLIIIWFVWKYMSDAAKREQQLRERLAEKENESASSQPIKKHTQPKPLISTNPVIEEKRINHENGMYSIETYKNGVQDGVSKTYFADGQLSAKSNYLNGKLHGPRKFYHQNGTLHQEDAYENGIHEGVAKVYYESGVLHFETTYLDGKKQGAEKEYYPNGQLLSECVYASDKKIGLEKCYFESGKLLSETNYIKKPLTEGKSFYESGKVMSEWTQVDVTENDSLVQQDDKDIKTSYESGAIKSVYTYRFRWNKNQESLNQDAGNEKGYYESGKIEYEEIYESRELVSKKRFHENGEPFEGVFIIKDGTGLVEVEEHYKNGAADGLTKIYGVEGELSVQMNFRGGFRDGETIKYDSDKRVDKIQNWASGKMVDETDYSYGWEEKTENKVIREGYHKSDYSFSRDKVYYESGAIKEDTVHDGDKYISKEFYESGQLQKEAISDNQIWTWKDYSESGKLSEERMTDKDLRPHGIIKKYYDNEVLKSEESYVHGAQHGLTKHFSLSGQLIAEIMYEDNERVSEKIYDKNAEKKFTNDW